MYAHYVIVPPLLFPVILAIKKNSFYNTNKMTHLQAIDYSLLLY